MAMSPIDYEALPYSSMPFPQCQPTHLAALAALHSRCAPPVETARVLELGCASGGNLIPLAARLPNAAFEGVDLSVRHVEEGNSLVRALALRNVCIFQGDIAALDLSGREFDYVICHGVFSWTPAAVQEAIFRICAQNLSTNGVAYISYNVLPGWHLQLIVRDICRRFSSVGLPPQLQIARARGTATGGGVVGRQEPVRQGPARGSAAQRAHERLALHGRISQCRQRALPLP